ncbi:MAG TPA: CusA/CzcA family heavy metal efflux RND transporter [Candidatus Binatia bacterium]|nr:CusA/CzcA family heavy metal efflux RND transporter [Candidatus Binatia bacterium]
MIDRTIEWSARNRFLVLLLVGFATAAGWWSLRTSPLDALPDLSDVQVIVFTDWPGRSPDLVEDQITYPIVSTMIAAPRVKYVRGESMFGYSFVNVVFRDGTDLYWARSRVLEYLQGIGERLPEGVAPRLGPDATGVGWVYEYALVDRTGTRSLAELRSFQDWYLRYWLASVPGVAEVASVGGFVKQYQVEVDPAALLAHRVTLRQVTEAIRRSNNDVGGRLVEMSGAEYVVRGRGYVRSADDIAAIAVGTNGRGTPVRVRDVARVHLGPDLRRGLVELDGQGEAVGGVVVMRHGENALRVIDGVEAKLAEVAASLPPGVEVVTTYDRSELIERAIDTLRHTLAEELAIVSLVILVFLWHLPSALIPIVTIPIAVLLAFVPMRAMGITANIMSLGGIAVAIGAMVDAAIVVVEQTHKKLERWQRAGRPGDFRDVVVGAVKEVGGPSFFSLLVIAVSFLPIFAFEAQEGRLFKPLAFTKNFSMAIAAVLAVTLDPAVRLLFTRLDPFAFRPAWLRRIANAVLVGTIHGEETHPISRPLMRLYHPVVDLVLRWRRTAIALAVLAVVATVPLFLRLGSEFMPPLNEGTILYMPTALPGMSITQARAAIQTQDRALMQFPEVAHVFGKAGRAESPTDPAPVNMFETIVTLRPESEWRPGMTWDRLLAEMDRAIRYPGMPNIWWMPIQTRTEMLATGIRSILGVKVFGPDLAEIGRIAAAIEQTIATLPGTRSVFAERTTGGYYLDVTVRRDAVARYGMTVGDVQDVVESAIGGATVSQTVEGRERYSIAVRYPRDERSDPETLRRVLVAAPDGIQVPLGQLADVTVSTAAPTIHDENGALAGFVYVDVAGRDLGSYVAQAKRAVAERVSLPPGYHLQWAGQFEYLERARARLLLVVPATLLIVFVLLYLNTGSVTKTMIVLLAVPFSAVGAVWLLWLLGYNTSIAVWVGLVALLGVDAETGVFMLLYLDLAWSERVRQNRMRTTADLHDAIVEGAVQRLRPKVMTVGVMIMGLLPIMWSHGTGADVMKRIAAPMIGGIVTSFLMELLVYPAIYALWRERGLGRASGPAPVLSGGA